MGSHPINLAVRFLLEAAALVAVSLWSWRIAEGWMPFALVVLVPISVAALWGTFAVPNDPSRSGTAPIAVPGIVRLLVEAGIFVFAVWALANAGFGRASWVLGVVVVIHYAASYDRVLWLIGK